MILQLPPKKRPDLVGKFGRAWVCSHPNQDIASPASVAAWLLSLPGKHPLFAYWTLGVLDMSLLYPGARNFEQATHEFDVFAVHPDQDLPDPDRWDAVKFVKGPGATAAQPPISFLKHQVRLRDHRQAQALALGIVQNVVMKGFPLHDGDGWADALDMQARAAA